MQNGGTFVGISSCQSRVGFLRHAIWIKSGVCCMGLCRGVGYNRYDDGLYLIYGKLVLLYGYVFRTAGPLGWSMGWDGLGLEKRGVWIGGLEDGGFEGWCVDGISDYLYKR